jgi:hypothetical protein
MSFKTYFRLTAKKQKKILNISTSALLRGPFKKYPTFGREKYIYTPGGPQP